MTAPAPTPPIATGPNAAQKAGAKPVQPPLIVGPQDVIDAVALVRTLSTTSFPVPASDLNAIVEMAGLTSLAAATTTQISSFWQSYNHLAGLIQPVTARDIKEDKNRFGEALGFQIFSLVVLILLLWLHVHWQIGTALLQQIPQDQKAMVVASNTIGQTGVDPEVKLQAQVDEQLSKHKVEAETNDLAAWRQGFWGGLAQFLIGELDSPAPKVDAKTGTQADSASKTPVDPNTDSSPGENKPADSNMEVKAAAAIQNDEAQQGASRQIFIFSFFMLPLAYGIFGSCIFTLRRLNAQMDIYGKVLSLHWGRILLRITLGGLAGVIIGWLNLPASGLVSSATTSVTPYILSMVAGYSMDTLFSILESLLKAVPGSGK